MFYVMQVELEQSFYFQPAYVPEPSIIYKIKVYNVSKMLSKVLSQVH